jgi:hypothetical protein
MVFGSLYAEGRMAEELSCLRAIGVPVVSRKFGGPDFAKGSISIRR